MQFIVAKIQGADAARPQGVVRRRDADPQAAGTILLPRSDVVTEVYTERDLAVQEARARATKYPTQQFGVFVCDEIFETTTPKVIIKHYNPDGELVEKK